VAARRITVCGDAREAQASHMDEQAEPSRHIQKLAVSLRNDCER